MLLYQRMASVASGSALAAAARTASASAAAAAARPRVGAQIARSQSSKGTTAWTLGQLGAWRLPPPSAAVSRALSASSEPPSGPASTPFVLMGQFKAKAGGVDAFLAWSKDVDKAVEDAETGMLMHMLCAHEDDPLTFTWVELYQNDAALRAHLANPAVGEALAKAPQHTDGMAIAIYGELAPETRKWADGLGLPITWYPWKLGFSGMMGPRSLPRA